MSKRLQQAGPSGGRSVRPPEQLAEAGQGREAHAEAARGPLAQNQGGRPGAGRATGREWVPIHRRCHTERTGHLGSGGHLLENKI